MEETFVTYELVAEEGFAPNKLVAGFALTTKRNNDQRSFRPFSNIFFV